jgi:hypothetical protein
VRLQRQGHRWIPLEEDVAASKRHFQFLNVQGLQIAARLQNGIAGICPQRLNLRPRAEMKVDAIALSGARTAAVEENQFLKSRVQIRSG